MMMSPGGAVYGPNPLMYATMMPHGRQDGGSQGGGFRSRLLDEFRANKSRKWELRVNILFLPPSEPFIQLLDLVGYLGIHC